MTFQLPDVPEADWNTYQTDEFGRRIDQRISGLQFEHEANSRITDLSRIGAWAESAAAEPPPIQVVGEGVSSLEQGGVGVTPLAPAAPPPVLPPQVVSAPGLDYEVPRALPAGAAPPPAPVPGGPLQDYARQAAQRSGIDPDIFQRQIQQESGFNPRAGSPAGAQGVAQIMPQFHPGVDTSDPYASLDYAANLMSNHLRAYGGDYSKALAAYNAGPGAVQKYGGVPPYEETQRYVKTILGDQGAPRVQAAPMPTADVSQFGDPQLTNDEAYAACGPAAAVRFAQRFGRNPTLREATDLAKTVGWTSSQGMAGLGSEKQLMDKLGVPTRLVAGADWGMFAEEAKTGNPVTISTRGHYFTADGYDPATNRFHVGRSGLDLRGGAEWMTPEQMTAIMGPVQGGLLADNPQVPSPSVAEQETNAARWLDRQRNALGESLGGIVAPVQQGLRQVIERDDPQTQQLDQAIEVAHASAAQPERAFAAGDLNLEMAQVAEPESLSPIDKVKSAFGEFVDFLGQGANTVLGPGQGPSEALAAPGMGYEVPRAAPEPPSTGEPLRQDVRDLGIPDQPTMFDALGKAVLGDPVYQARREQMLAEGTTPALSDYGVTIGDNPLAMAWGAGTGMPTGGEDITREREEWIARENPLRDVPVAGGLSTFGAQVALDPSNLFITSLAGRKIAPEVAEAAARAAARYGPEAGEAIIRAARSRLPAEAEAGFAAGVPTGGARAGERVASVMPEGTYAPPTRPEPDLGLFEAKRRAVVRQTTDRQVDLNQLQKDYARAKGAPLAADEMVAESNRIIGDGAAKAREQRLLLPALREVREGVDDYDHVRDLTTLRNNVQVARAFDERFPGENLGQAREFSGGLDAAQSEALIEKMRTSLGPERFARVERAADQVSDFSRDMRERMVESGVFSRDMADEMDRLYPDWVKTRILEFMRDDAKTGVGSKVGMGQRDLHAYGLEGTSLAREDPIASTALYNYQVERMARKNDTFNALVTLNDNSDTPFMRQVGDSYRPKQGEETVTGFVQGEKVRYVTDNPMVAQAVNDSGVMDVPDFAKAYAELFRNLATARNPLFLAGNAAIDIPTAIVRMSAWEGGPTPKTLARVVTQLARGYHDAFQGLGKGTYGEDTLKMLEESGGMSGATMARGGPQSVEDTARHVEGLRRRNVFDIQSKEDMSEFMKGLTRGRWIESIGERVELGPRTAAHRMAVQRGENAPTRGIQARDVTIDFRRGGAGAKYLNQFVPFLNVGVQGTAQIGRLIRENPKAAAYTLGTLIGMPTVAAEFFNRGYNPDGSFDAQRAKDYADVPQYDKDRGVIVMLPGVESTDEMGERRPAYAMVDLRGFGMFSTMARDTVAKALGDETRGLEDTARSIGEVTLPQQMMNPAEAVGSLGGIIPGMGTAAALQQNYDPFRERPVVTARADEEAGALAKALTPALQGVMDQVDPNQRIRPSAIDFAIRDALAGSGSTLIGAGNLALGQPRRDETLGSTPVVGGLLGRFIRSGTGEELRRSQEERMPGDLRRVFVEAGIPNYEIAPADRFVRLGGEDIPLTRGEQAGVQRKMNEQVSTELREWAKDASWTGLPAETKQKIISDVVEKAHKTAELDVWATIPQAEIDRRMTVLEDRKQKAAGTPSTEPSEPRPAPVTRPRPAATPSRLAEPPTRR